MTNPEYDITDVPCPMCKVGVGERCEKPSGRLAHPQHKIRQNLVEHIYRKGYERGWDVGYEVGHFSKGVKTA